MKNWMICFGVTLALSLQFTDGYETPELNANDSAFGEMPKKITTFVTGGQRANEGQFPSSICIRGPKGDMGCSGTIIHKNWVLTAAHCLRPEQDPKVVWITAGDAQWVSYEKTRARHNVTRIVEHPFWERIGGAAWDIKLLKVEPEFKFDDKFIKKAPVITRYVRRGTKCQMAGWGYTFRPDPEDNYLHWMNANVRRIELHERYVFGDPDKKASVRNGDSGAGFLCNGRITAILSAMTSNCTPQGVALAAGVFKIRRWIERVIHERLSREELLDSPSESHAPVNFSLLVTVFLLAVYTLF